MLGAALWRRPPPQDPAPAAGETRYRSIVSFAANVLRVLIAGVLLLALGVVVALSPVASAHGACGSWLFSSAPDDMIGGPACEAAQQSRMPFVAVPAAVGFTLLVIGIGFHLVGRRTQSE
jgi:hypothetical protein